MSDQVTITLIVMGGIVLSVLIWQVLSMGKSAMQLDKSGGRFAEEFEELKNTVSTLQKKIDETDFRSGTDA